MMNIKTPLAEIGWTSEKADNGDPLKHRIHGEICHWYSGLIEGREWSAWIGTDSGSVYLHSGGDMAFDEFVEVIKSGWPKAKVVPGSRSLFGEED